MMSKLQSKPDLYINLVYEALSWDNLYQRNSSPGSLVLQSDSDIRNELAAYLTHSALQNLGLLHTRIFSSERSGRVPFPTQDISLYIWKVLLLLFVNMFVCFSVSHAFLFASAWITTGSFFLLPFFCVKLIGIVGGLSPWHMLLVFFLSC